MSLAAEFDSRSDRYAYAVVSLGAAVLSYYHARSFFLPFMGAAGASATPLMLDAVVFWLASACIRQAQAGRPLPMLRLGAYAVLALAITANALGGATLWERVFMALPAALFGFLTEARTRLALYHHRAEHADERLRARLWLRHPVRTSRAWLWLARQSAPAFDRASAERDRLAAARDAVRLALPGRSRAIRRARSGVLRELNAGRLSPAAAVKASGLLTRPGVPELHRAALAAALGAPQPAAIRADSDPDTKRTRRQTSRPDTRTAVARMRDRHPDMTTGDIAARLGVSDRTVRRHLTTPPAPSPVAA
jgi:hypothetical protein